MVTKLQTIQVTVVLGHFYADYTRIILTDVAILATKLHNISFLFYSMEQVKIY